MSARIRGEEATVRISVDGLGQDGTWHKIKNFIVTPRQDIIEVDYLGERESDLDFQHHGWDLKFDLDEEDEKAHDVLYDIVARDRDAQAQPNITLTVLRAYRKPGAKNKAEVFHDVFLKFGDLGFGGRKEFAAIGVEAKAKRSSYIDI